MYRLTMTGLRHEAGHKQDAQAKMYFSDSFHQEGDALDVSGGWYDAGDYGKYISTATLSAAQLLLAYELHPDHFPKGQLQFPPSLSGPASDKTDQNQLPDLLAEVKFELDWMVKMQRPDGAVYHKVGGKQWPGFILPEQDVQDRYIYGLASYDTAQYAATMAMASRVYAPFAPEYAKELTKAKKAQQFLEKNPSASFRNDPGQNDGSGGYEKYTDQDERF